MSRIQFNNVPHNVVNILQEAINNNNINDDFINKVKSEYNVDLYTHIINHGHVKNIDMEELQHICNITGIKKDNFIETGTYRGSTTLMASELFKKVITFEIVEKLFIENREKFKSKNNIIDLLNDSLKMLPLIVPDLRGGTVYFLDAHISGNDTSRVYEEVPLIQELKIILENNNCDEIVIIIDDIRFFTCHDNAKPYDWKHITLELIQNIIKEKHNITSSFKIADRVIYKVTK